MQDLHNSVGWERTQAEGREQVEGLELREPYSDSGPWIARPQTVTSISDAFTGMSEILKFAPATFDSAASSSNKLTGCK